MESEMVERHWVATKSGTYLGRTTSLQPIYLDLDLEIFIQWYYCQIYNPPVSRFFYG